MAAIPQSRGFASLGKRFVRQIGGGAATRDPTHSPLLSLRKQISYFLDTPIGRSCATVFFLWFALSGWLFWVLIFATWVLPFAGTLLIGAIANNMVIEGNCPACKRLFIGNKNQMVRWTECGKIVRLPKGDYFSRGSSGSSSSKKSGPDIIDVEFEEK